MSHRARPDQKVLLRMYLLPDPLDQVRVNTRLLKNIRRILCNRHQVRDAGYNSRYHVLAGTVSE